MSRRPPYTIALIGLLVAVVGLQASCAGMSLIPVEANGSAAKPTAEAVQGPRHDVAVISLDLDPPLRLLRIGQSSTEVALLAVVDNKGTFTERQAVVTAVLSSDPGGEVLDHRREVIATLAPGQAKVVRFAGFKRLPPRSGYLLTVTVSPVPGEINVANNTKALPLQLVLPQ